MRTTLDIADDVLTAVKDKARRQRRSAGDLLSELAREALAHRYREDSEIKNTQSLYGFDPLPPRGGPVSNELVDKLSEETWGEAV